METERVKTTITMGKEKTLTMRVWLTQKQKEQFIVEKGKQPTTTFSIIIM